MLGYGGTSKPLDVMMYKGKDMAQDIVDILAHEKLEKVVGVAHDWYISSLFNSAFQISFTAKPISYLALDERL